MSNYPKILIAAPTSDTKLYCQDEWLRLVNNLTYKNHDVFLADNSQTRDNFKLLLQRGIQSEHIKPKNKSIWAILAESHEACRQHFLKHKEYFAMLHLETDVFPPVNIIEQLLAHFKINKLSVVSGIYPVGEGYKSELLAQTLEPEGFYRKEMVNEGKGDMLFINGQLKQVFNAGLGCCLIKRNVLEKIKFRYEKGKRLFPDSLFAADCDSLKIPINIDTSILCEHRNSKWVNLVA